MSTGLSKYYKLFGLPETATQADIKKRYRQLAMLYHPDKHGGDKRKFIEIKEAYEYLSGRRTAEQQRQTHTYSPTRSTSQARQQSNEERIKQAQQRKKDNEYKEYIENERYFQSLISGKRWNVVKLSAILGALVVFVLIMELFLPYRYEQARIVAYEKYEIGGLGLNTGTGVKKFFTESGKTYYIENVYSFSHLDPDIVIVKSAIFHNETAIIPLYGINTAAAGIQYNIGAHAYLLIPVFLFPVFVVLFKRRTYTFTLFYFLSLYLSAPLLLYFIFSGDRWFHLLTLGAL